MLFICVCGKNIVSLQANTMRTAYRHTMTVMILVVVSVLISACSPQRRQQAEMTVARADSLRAAGQYYNDSAALAEAVKALRPVRLFHPNSYAHACYHYGRMLIDANSPLPAVEQLLQAEQYAGKDYILRGHVYSNLAYLAQMELRWPIAYDIYQQAGNCFIQGKDTVSYYVSLYAMAIMSAYARSHDSTFVLIDSIRSNCRDSKIRIDAFAPAMQFYMRTHQYEVAIQYADSLLEYESHQSLSWITKAQAYHYLDQKDSACFYAEKVVATDSELFNLRSAYYILTNDDPNADKELIKQRAATRADIQHEMQHRQAELTQAVDYYLHEQQARKRRKIALFIGIFVGIALLLAGLLLYRRRRKHKRDIINLHKQNKSLQQTNKELLSEQEELYRRQKQNSYQQFEETCRVLCAYKDLKNEIHWNDYQTLCGFMDLKFNRIITKLQAMTTLKEAEVRLCVLVLIGLPSKEIAEVMLYSPKSIGRMKENVANKLGIHGSQLRAYLLQIMGF